MFFKFSALLFKGLSDFVVSVYFDCIQITLVTAKDVVIRFSKLFSWKSVWTKVDELSKPFCCKYAKINMHIIYTNNRKQLLIKIF